MANDVEPLYVFECEFEDGGEWYHLKVDIMLCNSLYYRCTINSIPDCLLLVNGEGRLCRSWASQAIIDVINDDNDQWIDLDFGSYSLVDKLGALIEKNTM